jgi:hypothetical protein
MKTHLFCSQRLLSLSRACLGKSHETIVSTCKKRGQKKGVFSHHPLLAADITRDDLPRIQAEPDLELLGLPTLLPVVVELAELMDHLQRRPA